MSDSFNKGFILLTLKKQIQKILEQYPDDGQILKELIQNAEDAGASEIKFLYDKGSYGTNSLYNKELAEFQGPALYAGNTAEFSEDDWKGIRMLNDSVKEDDPLKVGRFGLGFKSAFHMTDLPGLMSGNYVAYLDPHQIYFREGMEMTSSYRWNLGQDDFAKFKDQFEPFKVKLFDASDSSIRNGHYTGTLFRFPFRKEGIRSEVSKTVYNDSKVKELFESFKYDAHTVLMFLKSLEKIELYERNNTMEDPRILFRVQITPDCLEEVKRKRKEFISKLTTGNPIETTYPVTIETTDYANASSPKVAVSSWLVSQCFGGKVEGFNDVKRLPWVGIAAPLGSKPAGAHGITDNKETVTVKGQVFCFLPLPLPEDGESVTKFPFHVNGYFAVDHNRRHLKWPTPGSGKDQDVLWNQHLLKRMLPKALFEVLKSLLKELKTKPSRALKMIKDSSESRTIQLRHLYSILRSVHSIDHQWKKVMENLPLEFKQLELFYTESQNGRWLISEEVIFNTLASGGLAETKQILILRILQAAGTNIVNVPSEFLEACRDLSLQVSLISPDLVAQAFKKIQDSQSFTMEEVFMIIEYIGLDRIVGLKLLPLADETMTYFTNKPRNQEQCVFIETAEFLRTLLPRQERRFACMYNDGHKILKNIAEKGHTQLLYLNKDSVVALLPNVLPPAWWNPAEIWNAGSGDHPTTQWLEHIWTFLYTYYPYGIEKFENLHLLPDMNIYPNQMIRVAFDYPVIAPSGQSNGLSNAMLVILEKVNCRVLRSIPSYVWQHPCIGNYIKSTLNSSGLLDILERVHRHNPRQFTTAFQQLDGREIKEMKEFLVSNHLNNISPQNKQFLRTLPLFSIWKSPNHPFARLDQNLKGSPKLGTYFLNVKQNGFFLDLSDDFSKKIAECCSVHQIEIREYVSNYLLTGVSNGFYSNEEVQKIMKEVIIRYHDLSWSISDLSDRVKGLRFLPDSSSTLHTPNEIYDPYDEMLRSMLDDKNRFPHPDWQSFTSTLKLCGLKGCADVNADELYNIAGEIEKKGKPSNQSKAFLRYISKYPEKLQQDTNYTQLGEYLKNVRWVECCTSKPIAYPKILRWKGESATLVKPCELKPDKFSALVGSELYIQPRYFETSGKVIACFGWETKPDIDIVLRQLRNVISCYADSEKSTLFNVVKAIYEYFQELGSYQDKAKLFRLDEWVWQGNGFVKASSVVLNTPTIDMRPYIYGLPRELGYLEGFFSQCGVEKDCCQMKVLEQIKEYHDYQARQPDEVKRDLNIALAILDHINEDVVKGELDPDDLDLLIPVHSDDPAVLKLMPREECIYYDVEWLKGHFDVSDTDIDEEELNPLHKKVPIGTAENLKIPTFTSLVLEPEELDMSYGQSEPLTRRLNNLLKEYTDGFAVPKELIQNADDAGATEVKFLYDERKNEDAMTCLIGDGMKECQGPAFWAYNNASFADEDFENIVKLSGATKEEQTEKIGRFGLGFNAVYNLTDVPSFVSRHNFVVFDPHTTYLGKIIKDKSRPGIKLDMQKKTKKLKAYKNQFKPFNQVFGCDLSPEAGHLSFDGTLFRFPLRTRDQAQKSEISKLHYSETEMKELIRMLEKGADSLLLFTQNILKISVYHMKEDAKSGEDMLEIFTVSKAPVTFLKELSISRDLSAVAKTLSTQQKKLIQQSNMLGEAGVAIRNGTSDPKDICNSVIIKVSATQSNSEILQPDGSKKDYFWLITAAMGRNISYEKAKKDRSLVPVGGSAIRLHKNGNKYSISELEHGQLFCFLPLPVPISLPIHLNGTFALTSNRRSLYEKTIDDKKADYVMWNESLLEDAVCNAFIRLLVDLTNICDISKYSYHALWPDCHQMSDMLGHFTVTVYKKIATDENIKVFSDSNQWAALKDVLFLDEEIQNSEIGPTALKVLQEVENRKGTGTIATEIPGHIRKNFQYSQCEKHLEEQTLDLHRFYGKVFLPHIERFSAEDRNLLIRYALLKSDKGIDEMLRGSKCIPVQGTSDGLKCPPDLIHPKGEVSKLYTPEDERFPEIEGFKTSKEEEEEEEELQVLAALVRVGMIKDVLPWPDVLERAHTVSELPGEDAYERSKAVLTYIDYRLGHSSQKEIESKEFKDVKDGLIHTKFCQILPKPKKYPFRWQGDSQDYTQMLAPCTLYLKDSISLVGSVCLIMDEVVPEASNYSKKMHVTEFLGLKGKCISPDDVFKQLDVIETSSTTLAGEGVMEFCLVIYRYLSDMNRKGDDQTIAEILKEKKYLLISGSFLLAEQCAFEFGLDASPYLFKLPYLYQTEFETLMKATGVRERFPPQCMVNVIKAIKSEHQDKPLEENKLALVVNLLTEFTKLCHTEKNLTLLQTEQMYGLLYIPNTNKILKDAQNLHYNPQILEWLEIDEEMDFIHPTVSPKLAATLGLNTYRDGLVHKHSEGIDLGIPFGQKEELATRIRGILDGYPCDVEILKELVQNADDAEATEIHFVIDSRTHTGEKICSPSWHKLQGPALLVYNDKPFSHEDITGIQQLGIGSKGNDPSKTGQYGVGFNCVYHLTDVPTFLTTPPGREKVLCALDPCCEYVNGVDSASPGRMIEYNILKRKFQDMLVPFLGNEFNTDDGTLFRFPLRSKESAISSRLVPVQKIKELFKIFIGEMSNSLLFLNSLRKISVSSIDVDSGKLVTCYTVQAIVDKHNTEQLQEFNRVIKTISKSMSECPVYKIPYQEMTYEITTEDFYVLSSVNTIHQRNKQTNKTKDSKSNKQKWLITKCIGCTQQRLLPDQLKKALDDGDIKLLPKGGVAVCLTKLLKFDNQYGRLYCFLPLPSETYLPLHINGHFALDHANRRALWSGKDTDHRTQWNNMLFTDTLSQAYVNLIQHMTKMVKSESLPLAVYHSLFPDGSDANRHGNCLKVFIHAVYKCIGNERRKVLPVNRKKNIEWHTSCETGYEKVFFDNLELQVKEKNEGLSEKLKNLLQIEMPTHVMVRQTLLDCSLNLLEMPTSIKESFTSSGVDIQLISPEEVIDFLKSYQSKESPCHLGVDQLPAYLQDTTLKSPERYIVLLEYCLKSEKFRNKLPGLPLLLGADHRLHEFSSSNPKFVSDYVSITKPEQHRQFVHPVIVGTCLKLDSPCFKKFQTKDFAALLPKILSIEYKTGKSVVFNPDDTKVPNRDWIKGVWSFLNYCRNVEPELEAGVILSPLNDWSLLPTVQIGSQNRLVPIGMASTVVDTDDGGFSTEKLRKILKKFGIPEPYSSAIGVDNMSLIRSLVGNIDSPSRMIQALGDLVDRNGIKRGILEIGEAGSFLLYMKEQMEEVYKVAKAVQILHQLPLYLDVVRQLVPIYGKTVYIHPLGVPKNDLIKLDEEKCIVFLEHNTHLKKLFDYLGCKDPKPYDFYREVIFPNFEILSKESQVAHFRYLSKLIQGDDIVSKMLLQCLKELSFIRNNQGHLVTASQYLDPTVEVFKMFEPEKILPAEWHSVSEMWVGWLQFLKKIGLRSSPTVEQIVRYANKVESIALQLQDTKNCREMSEALLGCIFKRENLLGDGLLHQIKSIKFVSPFVVSDSIRALHSQYGERSNGQLNFFCFSGSVISTEKVKCCWTSAAILGTDYRYTYKWSDNRDYIKNVWENLNVKSLSIELVAEHLTNLCHKLQKEMEQPGYKRQNTRELKLVLKEIYYYLQCGDLNESIEKNLKELPIVLVKNGTLLVKPSQIALHGYSHQEIEPYLFIVPLEIGSFNKLFSRLGATEAFTVTQYAFVLQEIFSKSKGATLGPNEMRKVIKATKGLFTLIKEGKKLGEDKQLYLLSTNKTLEIASSMMYVNDASWGKRLLGFEGKLLAVSDEMGMAVQEIYWCLAKLPQNLQPKKLTEEIVEKLEDGLKDKATVDGALATSVRNKLQAEEFIQGMKRIMYHQFDSQSAATLNTFKEKMEKFETAMHDIKVLEVGNLKTFLTLHGKRIPKSEMEKDYHVEYDTWTIYLKNTAQNSESSMSQTEIVDFLDEMTRNIFEQKCISEKLHWVIKILEADPGQISSILDEFKVAIFGTFSTSTRRRYMPQLGTLVPSDLYHLLQANFENFEVGDYVAYQIFDELYDLDIGHCLEDGVFQEGYIYAQINKEILDAGNDHIFSRRYGIDVGNGEILTVPGVLLYKFIRTSVASDGKLVIYSGTNKEQDEDTVDSKPEVEKDMKAVCDEITDQLEAAWKCPYVEKRTIIKRLLLKWHPDKNYRNEAFATEVFTYLQNEIERLEKGLPRPSENERHNPQYRAPKDDYDGFYRAYYEETKQRARADRERHYQYEDKFSKHSHRPDNYDVPPTFQKCNPQPGEAKRWLRQAQLDLKAAPKDLPDASEWVCFKCHQAAEKALKAARFAEDAWWTVTHELNQIASGLNHPEIQELASRLQSLLGESAKMRYPDKHYAARIPHDHYTVDMAVEARDITERLVDMCREYIYDRLYQCKLTI